VIDIASKADWCCLALTASTDSSAVYTPLPPCLIGLVNWSSRSRPSQIHSNPASKSTAPNWPQSKKITVWKQTKYEKAEEKYRDMLEGRAVVLGSVSNSQPSCELEKNS